jgi:hypothetical protein
MCSGHHGWVSSGAIGLLAGSFLLACTEFEAGTDELEPASETLAQLPEGSGVDWSCLGAQSARSPDPGALGAAITYSLRLVDIATNAPFPGVTARACGLTDVDCTVPVTERLQPDADGWVHVPLTENFSGYLELEGPPALPYIFYLPSEGLRTMREFPLFMISAQGYLALVTANGVTDDRALGGVATRTFDCVGNPAPATVLTNNTGGVPYYFANGLPDVTRRQTDESGLAGYLNVPPGVTLIQSELGDGTVVSRKSVIVRPGWLSAIFMRPAPFEGQ